MELKFERGKVRATKKYIIFICNQEKESGVRNDGTLLDRVVGMGFSEEGTFR